MDITVQIEHNPEALEGIDITGIVEFAIRYEGKPESTEASVRFVDDDEIAYLNETYRGKVGPTDVLSFECDGLDDEFSSGDLPEDMPYELGDIVIATDVALRQTDEFGTTMTEEVELLLVHGVLHLCGYDHIIEEEALEMEALEREILAAWRTRDAEGVE